MKRTLFFTILISIMSCTEKSNDLSEENVSLTEESASIDFLEEPIVASNTVKVDSAKVKSLKSLFNEKKDDFSTEAWVQPKSRPVYTNQNGFYCYFNKDDDGSVSNFRFRGQYVEDDWLFITGVKFNVDGEVFDFYPTNVERDNDSGLIWEWFDEHITTKDLALIEAIANAKSVKVRFVGNQYHNDKVMSQKNIQSIKNSLEYYKALGGSFNY